MLFCILNMPQIKSNLFYQQNKKKWLAQTKRAQRLIKPIARLAGKKSLGHVEEIIEYYTYDKS